MNFFGVLQVLFGVSLAVHIVNGLSHFGVIESDESQISTVWREPGSGVGSQNLLFVDPVGNSVVNDAGNAVVCDDSRDVGQSSVVNVIVLDVS